MMRRAGIASFRTLCPLATTATASQRRWCTPTSPINKEAPATPVISAESTNAKEPLARGQVDPQSSTEPQEAFKINPAKVEASQAISGAPPAEDGAQEEAGDNAYKPVYTSPESGDAIIDATKAGYDKFGIPEKGSVEWFSRKALLKEGRADQVKAVVHSDDTSAPPILLKLAPGQPTKNIYNYTPDIPKHVTPLIPWMWTQHREHFEEKRDALPQWKYFLRWVFGISVFVVCSVGAAVIRLWMSQPGDIAAMRQEILQHSYGRVLELGAGSGSNIGIHPYPVTEIVMADRSEHQLQRLRYRLPKTSYPKYQVRLVDVSGDLKEFKDGEFDSVVDMFGLCHYDDPVKTLKQMQRVCKPTGTIILLEHGRSFWPGITVILDYLACRHTERTQGCRWNLPMEQYFTEARLVVKEYRTNHFGTTKYVVAYPEPREDNMTSIVEEEKEEEPLVVGEGTMPIRH